jgi:N utilization substance protein B
MSRKQTRSEARTEAFKLIFQSAVNDEEPDFLINTMLEERPESMKNIDYIKTVFLGVLAKKEEIDGKISENLGKGWSIDRISRVSLAVLRLAVFEILYVEDVPEKVAINEAVEIEKRFDDPDNSAFVNGVLGGFIKSL